MNKIENILKEVLQLAIEKTFDYQINISDVFIELPKDKGHGDYATNVAMQLAKILKQSPQAIATAIIENLDLEKGNIESCETAGPGFINFIIKSDSLTSIIKTVLLENDKYGSSDFGKKEKYNLEFVSANPTGDLHPGHARGAAMGDSVARIMEFAGYDVTREYYINDAGSQITNMALSLQARYLQHFGVDADIPEDGYKGKDIIDIAERLAKEVEDKYVKLPPKESLNYFREYGLIIGLEKIKNTLEAFRVKYDVWSSEQSIYDNGLVEESLKRLKALNVTYSKDGALWLKTTNFGDDKDRVLVKSDGTYTYLTPDIAYHMDKFDRGFDKLVDFLGADHHGYINRLKAAIAALGRNKNDLNVDIIQMVRMIKDNQEYKMSKRTGNALSLDDLVEEAGIDAMRYLFVSKAADSHMDFDIDMAVKQSNENPVYYVQYAHARLCSILRNVDDFKEPDSYNLLVHKKETILMKQINEFTKVINEAAKSRQPHKICNYVCKLASLFHSFYGDCKVIVEDKQLKNQRVALVRATKITIKNALDLIGVEAVERM